MTPPILLTSFTPWRAHQRSNSSDDLIASLQRQALLPPEVVWLRHLPVNFETAPIQVTGQIYRIRPQVVVCCGMAEKRQRLSLERQGIHQQQIQKTSLDLDWLIEDTIYTEISHDAGGFVCNRLYYRVLSFLAAYLPEVQALFIHIPLLTPTNLPLLQSDFLTLLSKLGPFAAPLAGPAAWAFPPRDSIQYPWRTDSKLVVP
ncbi:peptidase C15 [Romeria aff. gracilis LEGE 07310]|uniref:Peptidase C15 n=1 Tax=Vasconcelosia minhoensis LEGE 07310 TaxID=915328 RepID=A0A8J7AXG1_9CYAN|nr:peptidase C15 [Romeria gracilis]MBE9079278.1 peptidase C15 [Romeria aff. gracilis LEGE 07310]